MAACSPLRERASQQLGDAMTNRIRCFVVLILAAVTCLSFPADAQEAAEEVPARDTDFTFTLSKVIGQPGNEVSMPVLFGRKPGAANVATLRARVKYPQGALKYKRVEDAYLSRRVKLEVQAKESKSSGTESMLEMEFRLPDPQGSEFPSGHIATLSFDIAAGAADQVIHFNPDTWIDGVPVMPDSPQTLIEPGEVRVSVNPVMVGCFFFTH